jgi:hypothetical protein
MWRAVLIVAILLAVIFFFTQVVLPAWNNRPMFPLFRKRIAAREDRMVNALDDVDEARATRAAGRLNKKAS